MFAGPRLGLDEKRQGSDATAFCI